MGDSVDSASAAPNPEFEAYLAQRAKKRKLFEERMLTLYKWADGLLIMASLAIIFLYLGAQIIHLIATGRLFQLLPVDNAEIALVIISFLIMKNVADKDLGEDGPIMLFAFLVTAGCAISYIGTSVFYIFLGLALYMVALFLFQPPNYGVRESTFPDDNF